MTASAPNHSDDHAPEQPAVEPPSAVVVDPTATTSSTVTEPEQPPQPLSLSGAGSTPAEPAESAAVTPSAVRSKDWLNDPVTQHMAAPGPLLRADLTVSAALETVRSSQAVGRIVYFYVVDDEQRLQGVVPVRKLLLSPPSTIVSELMFTSMITIPATATVLEACEFFTDHKLLAFPVVDAARQLVGVVDVSLYTDEIQEIDRRQDADDLFQLIGIHLTEAAKVRVGPAFLGRFPWLLCNVLGGMLAAMIADAYQDVSTLAVVAPFIALVTALSESVSIQSVGLALQALHAQPPQWGVFARKLKLELLVGLMMGAACGLIVGLIAWIWKGSFIVAASLFLGITGGVMASAGVGLSLPFLMRLCHRDPQLASGPMALALADVVTLLCYFNLGRWLLA